MTPSPYPALNFLRARHVNLTPMTRSSDDMKEGELRLGDVALSLREPSPVMNEANLRCLRRSGDCRASGEVK